MATSTIKLYNVGFGIDQNAKLDSISDYLNTLTPYVINNFQLVKHDLDIFIKVDLDQAQAFQSSYNYVSILNSNMTRTYYYYIIKTEWVAQSTVRFHLSIDDLNTFANLLVFTSKTAIQREHKDRFEKDNLSSNAFSAYFKVDRIPENTTGLIKYLKTSTPVLQDNNQTLKWYLVYCANQEINPADTGVNTAINCYMVPSSDYQVEVLQQAITIESLVGQNYYGLMFISNSQFTVNGISYTSTNSLKYGIQMDASYGGVFSYNVTDGSITTLQGSLDRETVVYFNGYVDVSQAFLYSGSGSFYSMSSSARKLCYPYIENSTTRLHGDTTVTVTLPGIENVNRTLSYICKIIECPYAPIHPSWNQEGFLDLVYTTEMNEGMYALKTIESKTLFSNLDFVGITFEVTIPALASRLTATKDMKYETKLYHSDYYSLFFTYDSFVKEIPYEELKNGFTWFQDNVGFDIRYSQSSAMQSALGFYFKPGHLEWNKTETFEDFLVCDRNNEYPIYNSSYLDYIRTGYNYDKKAKKIAIAQSWTNTGVSMAGALGGLALNTAVGGAGAVSFATSAIRSISSNIFSQISMQNQIEEKLQSAKRSTASVEVSDDLDMLNFYCDNKLLKSIYSISDEVKSNVFELFYKCGYASYKAGIPNTSSRYRFNYLECEADFSTKNNPEWKQYLEDVMERFRKGVTYFHRYDDFEQTLENWETWMITE